MKVVKRYELDREAKLNKSVSKLPVKVNKKCNVFS